MKPVDSGVPLDLRSIRKLNEDSLQTRATQQLGAELKTASGSSVSKDEKLTAGQSDQVELKGAEQPEKAEKPEAGSSAETNKPEPLNEEQQPPSEPPSEPEKPTIEYSEAEKAFLERMEKKAEEADIWRQFWIKEFMAEQASRRDHFKNWLQLHLWTQEMQADLANERKIQSTKWSEAIGAML